MMFLCII